MGVKWYISAIVLLLVSGKYITNIYAIVKAYCTLTIINEIILYIILVFIVVCFVLLI